MEVWGPWLQTVAAILFGALITLLGGIALARLSRPDPRPPEPRSRPRDRAELLTAIESLHALVRDSAARRNGALVLCRTEIERLGDAAVATDDLDLVRLARAVSRRYYELAYRELDGAPQEAIAATAEELAAALSRLRVAAVEEPLQRKPLG